MRLQEQNINSFATYQDLLSELEVVAQIMPSVVKEKLSGDAYRLRPQDFSESESSA